MKGQGQSAEFFDFGAKKDRGNPADESGFYPAGVVLEVSRFTSREKFKASGFRCHGGIVHFRLVDLTEPTVSLVKA
jgi:hypothetical protein